MSFFENPDHLREKLIKSRSDIIKNLFLDSLFPFERRIKSPGSKESQSVDDILDWLKSWEDIKSPHFRVAYHDKTFYAMNAFVPSKIIFDNQDGLFDFLSDEVSETFIKIIHRLDKLIEFDVDKKAILSRQQDVLSFSDDEFHALCCFLTKKRDGDVLPQDPRTLSLPGVDGKFLERNQSFILYMLEATNLLQEGRDWREKMGFVVRNRHTMWMKFNPCDLVGPLGNQEFALRSDSIANMPDSITTLFIVENQEVFFKMIPKPGTCLIFGSGNSIAGMAEHMIVSNRMRIFYWGDIDEDGFKILDRFRGHFPQVRSFGMDYRFFQTLPDNIIRNSVVVDRFDSYSNLKLGEQQLLDYIKDNNIRIEQEHIPYDCLCNLKKYFIEF